jgi:bacteriorhodopsin
MMALRRPIWWWGAHAALGLLALVMAVMLTNTRRPPRYPLAWMRINLIVLLVVIFLASTARHMRLVNEGADQGIPWISGE